VHKNTAIAASVALLIGFGVMQILPSENNGNFEQVAQILDSTPSGIEQFVQDTQVKPRLTFINKDGDYCRLFDIQNKQQATENIACRKNNQWQLATSIEKQSPQNPDTYQTATGGSLLDNKIEEMAAGEFFDSSKESDAINQHWKK
jgi:hypothetical protein